MAKEQWGALKLLSTRVWRTYQGGALLEEWQGKPEPADGEFPEEWVASVVTARNSGRETVEEEGLSALDLPGRPLLKELIDKDPVSFLGRKHYEKYGTSMAVLVKLIDSLNRLLIQVHPDKAFARDAFASDYGKTEAWYIIGGREVAGVEPYVLFGFKPGITREKWQELFRRQDVEGMLNSLNRIPVKVGDVYLIEGGVPHAIGSGCFLIEIQEPTDYTIRVERTSPGGVRLPDVSCHQGAGFEKMFDCFHYDGYTAEEVQSKWKISPRLRSRDGGSEEWTLLGKDNTSLFRMDRLVIHGSARRKGGGTFCVAVVTGGSGRIGAAGGYTRVHKGETLFIPACADDRLFESDDGGALEIILCYPPD